MLEVPGVPVLFMSCPWHLQQQLTAAAAKYFSYASFGSKFCRTGLWITLLKILVKIAIVCGSTASSSLVMVGADSARYERTDTTVYTIGKFAHSVTDSLPFFGSLYCQLSNSTSR